MAHRMHSMIPVCVAAILSLAFAGAARASPKEDEVTRQARVAVQLFEAGKYPEALKQFLEAYAQLSPPEFVIPQVVWNVGRCYEKIGDDVSALQFFQEFEKYANTPEMKATAGAKIADVRLRLMAKVTVLVDVPGAEIRLDGKDVGVSPIRGPLLVDPGRRVIQVRKEGFRRHVETLEVSPKDAQTLRVSLRPIVGQLDVSAPAGTNEEFIVSVDGRDAYRGGLPTSIQVPAGRHKVAVARSGGGERQELAVNVPDSGRVGMVVGARPGTPLALEGSGDAPAAPRPVEVEPVVEVRDATLPETGPVADTSATAPQPVSALKAGLFWSGLGIAVVGGVFHVWGYLQWKNADKSGGATYSELEGTRSSAAWKYYTGFALYGVAGAAVVASIFAGEGRHPLTLAASPTPGGAMLSASTTW